MSFLIRFIHVGSASFLFGGAVLIFILIVAWQERDAIQARALLELMTVYEWGFWAAMGLLVATGVGNLGAFGQALPEPDSEWGRDLLTKLIVATLFVFFAVVRTISLAMTLAAGPSARRSLLTLQVMYGGTAVSIAVIVGLAVALAHF